MGSASLRVPYPMRDLPQMVHTGYSQSAYPARVGDVPPCPSLTSALTPDHPGSSGCCCCSPALQVLLAPCSRAQEVANTELLLFPPPRNQDESGPEDGILTI